MYTMSLEQARDYLVQYHMLDQRCHKSQAKQVFDRLRTIQYDPLKVVGRNAELVLKARINDFHPSDLNDWLYHERWLMDGWDKMMSIYPVDDREMMTPVSLRHASAMEHQARQQLGDRFESVIDYVLDRLRSGERLKNSQLTKELDQTYGSFQPLDYLFHRGQAEIVDRKNTQKIYRLTQSPPNKSTDDDFLDWYIYRRIQATGLIRPKRTDAWLGHFVWDHRSRDPALERLLERELISQVKVKTVAGYFLIPTDQIQWIENMSPSGEELRLLAPLDNFLWDRQLIEDIFDFYYRWEVYVPAVKRQWGYYVLPIVHGNRLIGRLEPERTNNGTFRIKQIWWEDGAVIPSQALEQELATFETFLHSKNSVE